MLVVEYWRDGIFRFWTGEKYFVVTTSEMFANTLEIIVPVSQGGYELLGYLVDHIDTLIEEWYPGLGKRLCILFQTFCSPSMCLEVLSSTLFGLTLSD